jgi:signal transduction histidine kinase
MKKFPKRQYFYQILIAPRTTTPDEKRRELILNILLTGILAISLLIDAVTVSNHIFNNSQVANSVVSNLVFTLILALFLWLSRKGFYRAVSYILLSIILLAATQLLLTWSFELPATQLAFVVFLVLAGVLLASRTALWLTFGLSIYVLYLSYAQVQNQLHPDTSWLHEKAKFGDSIGFVAGLLIIGLVSWLANREIDRSLIRARNSEAELALERDQLEVKVVERTRELERAQLERVIELQRLAEFGRLSAGLLHDVANPLTVASLNLQQFDGKSADSLLVRRAVQSLQYIERYLDSARKQLRHQGEVVNFVPMAETKQVMAILKRRAVETGVTVTLRPTKRYRLTGDPVKFSQVVANLVLNAIEAYDGDNLPAVDRRVVLITLKPEKNGLRLAVKDHGRGLAPDQIGRIFDSLYTTRPGSSHMGIGLATVKHLVEDEFAGRITVTSSPRHGTVFTAYLFNQDGSEK